MRYYCRVVWLHFWSTLLHRQLNVDFCPKITLSWFNLRWLGWVVSKIAKIWFSKSIFNVKNQFIHFDFFPLKLLNLECNLHFLMTTVCFIKLGLIFVDSWLSELFVNYFLGWLDHFCSNTVLQKWVHAIVDHNPCKVKQQRVCSKYKPNVDSCINWLPSRPSFSPCTPWPSMKKFRVDPT